MYPLIFMECLIIWQLMLFWTFIKKKLFSVTFKGTEMAKSFLNKMCMFLGKNVDSLNFSVFNRFRMVVYRPYSHTTPYTNIYN